MIEHICINHFYNFVSFSLQRLVSRFFSCFCPTYFSVSFCHITAWQMSGGAIISEVEQKTLARPQEMLVICDLELG